MYLTGFGAFGTITNNPTMEIINEIDISPLKELEGYTVNLKDKEVVQVDIDSVNSALDRIHEAIDPHTEDGSHNLIVHLGVNSAATEVRLEKQAVNCNDFRIPDAQGNQPCNEMIDKCEKLDHCYECKIDIPTMCKTLADGTHSCSESTDAGRYICNYTYYCSLREFAEFDNTHVIFIHVPQFETQSKDKQIACILDFIKHWILSR